MDGLTKFDRINILKQYGLNVLPYTLFKKGTNWDLVMKVVLSFPENISVRTQNPLGGLDVYYPKNVNIQQQDALPNIKQYLNDYDVLISEAINPDLCCICGNIALLKDQIILETVNGAGTLDRLTRENKLDNSWVVNYFNYRNEIKDVRLQKVINKVLNLPMRNIIIEFSIYREKVSIFNDDYIVWEFTNY